MKNTITLTEEEKEYLLGTLKVAHDFAQECLENPLLINDIEDTKKDLEIVESILKKLG